MQPGYPPLRIDLLTSWDAWTLRGASTAADREIGGVDIPFLDLDDLRRNKRAAGRHQDLADFDALDER